jgi:hypothetical protein
MRQTIRHVAVLAVAALMFTVIAVPAQGKGGPSQKIDYVSFKPIPSGAECLSNIEGLRIDAWDASSKPRVLIAVIDNGMPRFDEVSGTGHLQVHVETGDEFYITSHQMWVALYAQNPKTGDIGKLIEMQAFAWPDECPWP